MNLQELKQVHLGWIQNPNVSRGQYADSRAIVELINTIEKLEGEVDHLRQEWQKCHELSVRLTLELTRVRKENHER